MSIDRGGVRFHHGKWELRLQVAGRRVTRRFAAPNTRAGRRAAEEALDELMAEMTSPPKLTVADLLDRYLAAESHRWKPSTREKAPGLARSIKATPLGSVSIVDLRPKQIRAAWQTVRDAGRAEGTIRRYHALLSGALAFAVDEELIDSNPAYGLRLGTMTRTRIEDLPAFEATLAAVSSIENERLRSLALVALGTGARRGELAALRWSDVDLEAGTVRITAAISGQERSTTKAGPGRTIRVDPGTIAALKAWRPEAKRRALAMGRPVQAADPIWTADVDPTAPWVPNAMSSSWSAVRKGLGLDAVRFHDLRHIHATALLRARVPVHVVAHRLGHASPKMTLDVYSHVLPGDDDAAVAAITAASTAG